MNEISLRNIQKKKNKIVFQFEYTKSLEKYFNSDEEFFIEYFDTDIDTVPDSILVVPFLCNVLPIAWVLDARISVPEIDEVFYKSIPEFKKGYVNMYPQLSFAGEVIASKVIANDAKTDVKEGTPLAFFSGGVDAFNTLVNHIDEKPILMTLWGSDVFFDDIEGWDNVKKHVSNTSECFSLKYKFIKSNFRKFINGKLLTELVISKAGDHWWHGFQHGIGLIGHAAPITFNCHSKLVYIASSFTAKDAGKVPCASDPTIDNYVRWGNTEVIHDGYEFTRQDKIKNICDFVRGNPQAKINLRVCWQSSGGKNCCKCEKCYRTIMGILAERQNPNDYGLFFSAGYNKKMERYIVYKIKMDAVAKCFWIDIQNKFLSVTDVFVQHPELMWIAKINFERINDSIIKRVYWFMAKIKNKIKEMVKKKNKRYNVLG